MNCKLCNSKKIKTAYHGPVRGMSENTVLECDNCCVQFLADPIPMNYGGGYRDAVGNDDLARHLPDIAYICPPKTSILGKHVLDVGASDGQYMDMIAPYAKTLSGVEPNMAQRDNLAEYTMYSSIFEAEGKFDTITCWHVIEHIEDPVAFMDQLYNLLEDDGRLYLSTPNREEILMSLLSTDFAPFFYRAWHPWAFNQPALEYLALTTRFRPVYSYFGHSWGMGNLFGWLRDKKPCGEGLIVDKHQTDHIDHVYRQWLETIGLSDTLYLVLSKEKLQ